MFIYQRSRKQKTFQQIKSEYEAQGIDIFPSIDGLDEDFKNAVSLWFDLREVANDANFYVFFQRVLFRDFGQYMELLRIEPHVAKYDWLVQQYHEALTQRDGSETTSFEASKTEEGSSETTDTRTISSTRTDNLTEAQTYSDEKDETKTRTDNLTEAKTISESYSHGHTVGVKSSSSNISGGTDTTTNSQTTDSKTLAKDNPMSVSYGAGMSISSPLDWQYASSQAENGTTQSGTDATQYGRTETISGSSTTTNGGTDTKTGGDSRTNTGTQTSVLDSDSSGERTKRQTGTQQTVDTHGGKLSETSDGSTSEESTKSSTKGDVTKHIDTGRAVDIATLLGNATSFIVRSSAFEWIRGRLEPCFMGIYYDDEY